MVTQKRLLVVTSSLVLLAFMSGVTEGIPCTNDTTCVLEDTNSYCDASNNCACSAGFILRDGVCSKIVIGNTCLNHSNCSNISNSACVSSTCTCLPLYMVRPEEDRCVRKACRNRVDCAAIYGSYCLKSLSECACRPGFYEADGRCYDVTLNYTCNRDRICTSSTNNFKCTNGRCQCATGYITNNLTSCRPRVLGDNCDKDDDCGRVIERVVCQDETKKCSCDSGYRPEPDQKMCVRKVIIGDNCASDIVCDSNVPGSSCVEGRCSCAPGFTASAGGEACRPRQLLEACNDLKDCQKVDNAECSSRNVCVCLPGYTARSMVCAENVIGDSCSTNAHCRIANSVCRDEKCACRRGWAPDTSNASCSEQLLTDTDCAADEHCRDIYNNSECYQGFCRCQKKYVFDPVGNSCEFFHISDSCNQTLDCTASVANSFCSDQVCACSADYLPSDDRMSCRVKRLQGTKCLRDDYCSNIVPHSFCDVNSKCSCVKGFDIGKNFDACVPKRLLLDPCADDGDCLVNNPHSLCSSLTGRCVCSAGFSLQNLTARPFGTHRTGLEDRSPWAVCEKRVLGNHACDVLNDCLSAINNSYCRKCNSSSTGSACVTATCQCVDGFYAVANNTKCQGRLLGERCARVEDCSGHVLHSNCTRDVCVCSYGYKMISRNSCQKKTIGDSCLSDVDCESAVDYSLCAQGVCVCKPGRHGTMGSSECQRRRIGDTTCVVDADCSSSVDHSYCRGSQCVCQPGFHPSPTLYDCHKRRLGDYCSLELDCRAAVPDTVCNNHACVCSSGFYNNSLDLCVRRKVGDLNCKVDPDCGDAVNNSICVGGGCQCRSGYYDDLDFTACLLRGVGSVCRRNQDCVDAVAQSQCSQEGRCICAPGHQSSGDGKTCSKRTVGSTCVTELDCNASVPHSNCSSDVCRCMPGYDVLNNNTECVKAPTLLGMDCYNTEQCRKIDPSSTCSQSSVTNKCWCPDDTFIAVNRSMCIKLPALLEDVCARNEHCSRSLLNSRCDTGVCRCLENHIPKRNNTGCLPPPAKLGDFCRNDTDCTGAIDKTECEVTNSTCVCQYGYTESTNTLCTERPRLPEYVPPIIPPEPPTTCSDTKKCDNLNNTFCDHGKCKCDFRFAQRQYDSPCVPVQTYELTLYLTEEAKTYDYVPLEYKESFSDTNSTEFLQFAYRVSQRGIEVLFFSSGLSSRYVSSNVIEIVELESSGSSGPKGVKVNALLHLTAYYLNATSSKDIYSDMKNELERSDRLLGESGLRIRGINKDSFSVTDYDECALKERNDCSLFANCLNTVGSFICVCKPRYEDVSAKKNLRPGRDCAIPYPVTTVTYSELCSSDDCQTNWEYVALALTLFFLVVMSFITYEIIQRKQDFSARKLYEKFGTTKIRKLRQASMRRIQESKRKRREEIKRKKEDKKKKKEEEKNQKNEEKKLKILARKETKKAKKDRGRKGADSDVNDDDENNTPSVVEIVYPPSFAEEEICHVNIPGSTGDDDRAPRIVVSSAIEESPV